MTGGEGVAGGGGEGGEADEASRSVWLGVAVEVPEPLASQVQAFRTSLGDDASGVPTHITLVPPTEVGQGDDVTAAVAGTLADAAALCAPFPVRLKGSDSFRPVSDVAYVVVEEGWDCLVRLAERARTGPLGTPAAFPFHPHVTLAHGVSDEALDEAVAAHRDVEAAFTVDAVTLYRRAGGSWQPHRRFPLTGTAPTPT